MRERESLEWETNPYQILGDPQIFLNFDIDLQEMKWIHSYKELFACNVNAVFFFSLFHIPETKSKTMNDIKSV